MKSVHVQRASRPYYPLYALAWLYLGAKSDFHSHCGDYCGAILPIQAFSSGQKSPYLTGYMWPETKPLPSEPEVCARVVALREKKGVTQHALAAAAWISQSQLANIEIKRRNVYFRIGWNICKALNVNQWFLATGQGPMEPFHNFDPQQIVGRRIKETASFVAVCCRRLADELERRNELLTKAESAGRTVGVKLQLPVLLERLKRATAKPGKKSELAKALRPVVPLASVSRWLSGEREPGGEVTLQLLKWVEQQGF